RMNLTLLADPVAQSIHPVAKQASLGGAVVLGALCFLGMVSNVSVAAEATAGTAQATANLEPETPGDAAAGQGKAGTCVACHGLDGNSPNPEWPSIAGQHAEYTYKQLQAYKSGARQNVLMTPMAQGLSEQDMWDLGAYYASQTAK